MARIVYFSSPTNNTHRFVQKVINGTEETALRIPIHGEAPEADEPYVLILPTYGGGAVRGSVPRPVIRFLNNEHNRGLIRGVVVGGNTNFGEAYGLAGDVVAKKCNVPLMYRFELLGTATDVEAVRQGLEEFWQTH
ncbi:class Ib ribonucleoside-diphosphate reductase assembly flavoprotein NrdI [Actinotignum urinale]|uniref:Protein NrdI n=1 Tax=Actinotignum urinale TaxID=190146 RepID=A0AAW9HU39_9ACTO|nr:class Ib ribonucleoside-diphosphate reductase assembly flavoprotein NrdI [Actinotignum urinale]MDY5128482.1 class Ib ribonucleoside-diphosphate reductase assembly flavoprotein NrdI [Actinotignum urinale]MDY5132683.1 class Ib ribonucleoside-diphosphate reductase assembly flavoprotein NrdI [Actinotignum urinale]MDY5155154.1 class Ib ribonucleoside-diphosphate reductase assembly flavoprotein NrdI [Actinotignum urinale]MDY5160571.1 class Ib ribonucleoside-diphosphate reductase assembly flavoprot